MIKLVVAYADFDRALEVVGPNALVWSSVESWIAVSEKPLPTHGGLNSLVDTGLLLGQAGSFEADEFSFRSPTQRKITGTSRKNLRGKFWRP